MGKRLLKGIKTVIKRQQGVFAKGNTECFLLRGENRGMGVLGTHGQMGC